ncbi:MAG TPA: hypothetical protein VNJ11_01115, partial [Bryobacteraceae bacterium]|nr:hypothetical protein [Bryobacteraceae bacterium]
AEVQPATTLEQLVFDQLLAAAWNLRRLRRLEAELFDGTRDPLTDPALEARLHTLARYQARAERSFYRALKELRTLETQRASPTRSTPGPPARSCPIWPTPAK